MHHYIRLLYNHGSHSALFLFSHSIRLRLLQNSISGDHSVGPLEGELELLDGNSRRPTLAHRHGVWLQWFVHQARVYEHGTRNDSFI